MNQEKVDISDVPENYHEWRKMVNDAENRFNTLPAELKEKFNNSVEQYISEMGTAEWAKKLGWKEPIETTERKEEVNSEQKQ